MRTNEAFSFSIMLKNVESTVVTGVVPIIRTTDVR